MSAHLLVALFAACSPGWEAPPVTFSALDPTGGFDAMAQVPPPPVSLCPVDGALLNRTPYPSAYEAMLASAPGDYVWLCPGTHTDMLTLNHAGPLSIAGITGDPNDVVIDAINYVDDFLTPPEYAQIRVANLSFIHFDTNNNSALVFLRGAELDLQNLVFRENLTATYIWLNRFYWARLRDIEAYNTGGKVLDAYTRLWAMAGPYDPPGVLHVENLYIHDNIHTIVPWTAINLSGDGIDASDRSNPRLQAVFDNLVVEDNEGTSEIMMVHGQSYRLEFNDLRMSRNVSYTTSGCGLGPGLLFIGGIPGAVKQLSFTNPVIEDNVLEAGIYNSARGSVDPRDSQLRITGGSIVRNTTCAGAVQSWGSVGIRDVDFGEGVDTNLPYDFTGPCGAQDVAPGEVIRQSMPEAWTRPWCP